MWDSLHSEMAPLPVWPRPEHKLQRVVEAHSRCDQRQKGHQIKTTKSKKIAKLPTEELDHCSPPATKSKGLVEVK